MLIFLSKELLGYSRQGLSVLYCMSCFVFPIGSYLLPLKERKNSRSTQYWVGRKTERKTKKETVRIFALQVSVSLFWTRNFLTGKKTRNKGWLPNAMTVLQPALSSARVAPNRCSHVTPSTMQVQVKANDVTWPESFSGWVACSQS